MKTITPSQALGDYKYAIISAKDPTHVYGLYRNKHEAVRIAKDLNKRHGDDAYYPAEVGDCSCQNC